MLAAIARKYRVPVAMVNQIGGNDSLVFDGSSLGAGARREVLRRPSLLKISFASIPIR